MPIKPCLTSGCPDPATYRGRCQRHARQRERQTHRNKSFYNSKRWRMTRRKQLSKEPLCRDCGKLATDVDHIQPIEQGGDRWSSSNLRSLCGSCHSKKTRAEQHGD